MGQRTTVRTLHYTTREGMASNVVNTIMQDRQGYLWLGTNLGLTRFDGYRFVNFYHEEDGKRRIENVTGIVEDTARNRRNKQSKPLFTQPQITQITQILHINIFKRVIL